MEPQAPGCYGLLLVPVRAHRKGKNRDSMRNPPTVITLLGVSPVTVNHHQVPCHHTIPCLFFY